MDHVSAQTGRYRKFHKEGTGMHTNTVSGQMVIIRLNYGWGTKMFTNCCDVSELPSCELKWMPGMG